MFVVVADCSRGISRSGSNTNGRNVVVSSALCGNIVARVVTVFAVMRIVVFLVVEVSAVVVVKPVIVSTCTQIVRSSCTVIVIVV